MSRVPLTNGRRCFNEAVALMVPLSFVFIPVIGMLWMLAPQLPPPWVSLVRIGVFLGAAVTVLYLVARRRSRVYASNIVGLPLLLVGLYPSAHSALTAIGLSEAIIPWAHIVIATASAWMVARLSGAAAAILHDVLRGIAVVVTIFGFWLIYHTYIQPPPYSASVQAAIARLSSPLALPSSTPWKPDVYHLVLDGMGRPDIIERDYAISLSSEFEALQSLGFVISPRARANYVQTQLSLSSMLNLEYLDELARAEGGSNQRGPLRDLISNARVPALFKRLGYRVEFVGSGYLSSGAFDAADECDCPQLWFADAEFGALSLSPLSVLFRTVGNRAHYDRSLAIFDRFAKPRSGLEPRYVFAHVPMPHPPFVADARGQFTNPSASVSGADGSFFEGSPEQYRSGYRAQASFVLSRAVRTIRSILRQAAQDGRDVVMIVHGDHGPRLGFDMRNPTVNSGVSALPIFLVVRWPQGRAPRMPPESLVNVYRGVFQSAFQMNLPPLPDRSFVSAFATPYVMVPVTTPQPSADGADARE